MLIADLTELAEEVGSEVFDEFGTELVVILRPVTADDDYGGAGETSIEESIEYPCILEYPSAEGSRLVPVTAGQEYAEAVITMPAVYQGEAVEVRKGDRLKVLERDGNNPERIFQVKRPKNHFGVYQQIEVVSE